MLVAKTLREVRPLLRAVQEAAANGQYAAGFVAYEAAPAFDPALAVQPPSADLPLAWFALFDAPREAAPPPPSSEMPDWTPSVRPADHAAGIHGIREAIAAGNVYQVNHTLRMRAALTDDPFAVYERLRRAQQAAYAAYLDIGPFQILSVSPELFFQTEGRRIVTRPMKGTRPRGRWAAEDETLRAELAASEKDRAENLMIVDLLRNDLGRVSEMGSVTVPHLFAVERYPTVWQMTSTVAAALRPEVTLEDILAALFPCGSVTGAPKVAACRRIAEGEDSPRGVYCGAVGLVRPGGDAVFNVAIRTVTRRADTGRAEYGVGGGIVWDSEAGTEWREAMTKAAVLTARPEPFDLLETLRLEDGDYWLRERHLARLRDSAACFGVPISQEALRAALQAQADACGGGIWRVRLLVGPSGAVRAEAAPLAASDDAPRPVALADAPVSRADRFLFHKTTRRQVYTDRKRPFPDAFDVLLWNEDGELTEFTIGNLVAEIGGQKWTPPISCGLLPGTFRAELLARGEIRERILRRPDLDAADALWLINSVRGWVRVALHVP